MPFCVSVFVGTFFLRAGGGAPWGDQEEAIHLKGSHFGGQELLDV